MLIHTPPLQSYVTIIVCVVRSVLNLAYQSATSCLESLAQERQYLRGSEIMSTREHEPYNPELCSLSSSNCGSC